MTHDPWLKSLFAAIDAKDTSAFIAHLTSDAQFQFGNMPLVLGADAIATTVRQFFDSIAGLRHEIDEDWHCGDTTICRGRVTYTRHDGSTLTVPFANTMKRRDGSAAEYRIYGDMSQLYAGESGK